MIEEVAETDVSKEKQKKIMISTLFTQVSMTLGSKTCMENLRMLNGAKDANVEIP